MAAERTTYRHCCVFCFLHCKHMRDHADIYDVFCSITYIYIILYIVELSQIVTTYRTTNKSTNARKDCENMQKHSL